MLFETPSHAEVDSSGDSKDWLLRAQAHLPELYDCFICSRTEIVHYRPNFSLPGGQADQLNLLYRTMPKPIVVAVLRDTDKKLLFAGCDGLLLTPIPTRPTYTCHFAFPKHSPLAGCPF